MGRAALAAVFAAVWRRPCRYDVCARRGRPPADFSRGLWQSSGVSYRVVVMSRDGCTPEHGEPLGFQITFFRTKPAIDAANPSAFAARQLLIAHCAISDPTRGHLWQDQKIRRAGLGLAESKIADTDVWVESWSLRATGCGLPHADRCGGFFCSSLALEPTQDALLNGDARVTAARTRMPAPRATTTVCRI